ncbi:MAG: hypothetical protein DYG91_13220, partial [Chloroflexi bacterium CFX7]|nr:hypothetical protein [Chloroflexi bacterium CFX7]
MAIPPEAPTTASAQKHCPVKAPTAATAQRISSETRNDPGAEVRAERVRCGPDGSRFDLVDGATGEIKLHEENHASGTLYEYPLVVDVDGDDVSEIVLASNNYTYSGWTGITVIGDATGTWRPSRPIWNQFAYHITHVDDDGGVPAAPESNWTRWNSFRAAASTLGRTSDLADLAPGEPQLCTTTCPDGLVDVLIPVENTGLYDVESATVAIRRGEFVVRSVTTAVASGEVVWLGPFSLTEEEWGGGIAVRV